MLRYRFALMLLLSASGSPGAQNVGWVVDTKPALILGDAAGDANVLFGAGLRGATRLPNGSILVGDPGDYSLKLFGADGKFVRYAGRKGAGPGEIARLRQLFRCGSEVMAYDIENGNRVSVFDFEGKFKRSFRFGTPVGTGPYASACNGSGTFVHYAFEVFKDFKPGIFRANVPLWTTRDSSVLQRLGQIPGSERLGFTRDGVLSGTRPLPLGKQSVIAIDDQRVYIGTADSYEILVRDLAGTPVGVIRKASPPNLATTKADIDFAIEAEQAGQSEAGQKQIADNYAKMELPKTIPAYSVMLIDSEGLLWVQDYRRGKASASRWTVFTPAGAQRAELLLPAHFDVYEVGSDYILGRYIDPIEQIPQIRLYRLRRAGST